jgi:hypothetical protein
MSDMYSTFGPHNSPHIRLYMTEITYIVPINNVVT